MLSEGRKQMKNEKIPIWIKSVTTDSWTHPTLWIKVNPGRPHCDQEKITFCFSCVSIPPPPPSVFFSHILHFFHTINVHRNNNWYYPLNYNHKCNGASCKQNICIPLLWLFSLENEHPHSLCCGHPGIYTLQTTDYSKHSLFTVYD